MRAFAHVRRLAPIVLAGLVAGACGDAGTEPGTIPNPGATFLDLVAVYAPFESPVYLSLKALSGYVTPTSTVPAVAAPATLSALLRVTLPDIPAVPRPGTQHSLSAADLRLFSRLRSAANPTDAVLPDSLLGKTFEWDTAGSLYVLGTRTGGPFNGVRFVLYDVDTLIHLPLEPLVEFGTLDVIDHAPATGGEAQLQLLLRGVTGTPVYLDYTLTLLSTTGGATFTLQASGFVSNGQSGSAERRLDFDAPITLAETSAGGALDISASYNAIIPVARVDLHYRIDKDTLPQSARQSTTFDFRLTRPGETIQFVGGDTTFFVPVNAERGRFLVKANGGLYATFVITAGVGVLTDRNGREVPLNDPGDAFEEDNVLVFLLVAVVSTVASLDELFAVPEYILNFSFTF